MKLKEVEEFFLEKKIPKFRVKQVIKAVYIDGVSNFSEITTLPVNLREEMDKEFDILSFSVKKITVSKDKKSFKALLKLRDENLIETVMMSPVSGKWSTCISSQVGCALGCKFCATGNSGFKRNLETEEITDQVLFWKEYLKKEKIEGVLGSIVFMGMGEPFMNYEAVKKAVLKLTDAELFNFGFRHISISTSGIPEGIRKMSNDFPQLNLAISLITARDKKRLELMPINKKYNVEKIKEALEYYFSRTNRKVFLEYILLEGVNDSIKDANALIDFINTSARPDLLHVNIIGYNNTSGDFKASSRETTKWFKDYLGKNKISVTVRRSLGSDIEAACGQLAGSNN